MLSLHAIANPSVICEDWCHEPCTQLNGNVQLECGGCSAEGGYSCFPHAAGWSDWPDRARPPAGDHEPSTMPAISEAVGEAREKEPDGRTRAAINDEPRRMFVAPGSGAISESLSHESVPIEESAVLSASEALPCQRVTAPELRAMSPAGRAALFARPTLVSALIDDCTPPGPPDEDPHELHMRKLFCLDEHRSLGCNGAYGAARARWHAERFERPADGKFAWTLEHEEWLRGSRI